MSVDTAEVLVGPGRRRDETDGLRRAGLGPDHWIRRVGPGEGRGSRCGPPKDHDFETVANPRRRIDGQLHADRGLIRHGHHRPRRRPIESQGSANRGDDGEERGAGTRIRPSAISVR